MWPELVLLPLLAACETTAAPVLVDGAERFAPPPAYQLWWEMVSACSAESAPLSGVKWYVVRGASTVEVDGDRYAGYWSEAGNAIVLAESAMLDGSLVRHEMLHSLIGHAGHRRSDYLGSCGGVVGCDRRCIADAGALPPVDGSITRVGADVLEVDVRVTPAMPSPALFGGHFAVVVTAHNPWSNPLAVQLTTSADGGERASFRYQFTRGGGSGVIADPVLDDAVTRFAPGETKQRVFDFRIAAAGEPTIGGALPPGTYQIIGGYGDRWADLAVTITLPGP